MKSSTDTLVYFYDRMMKEGVKPATEIHRRVIGKMFTQYFDKVTIPGKTLHNLFAQPGNFLIFFHISI